MRASQMRKGMATSSRIALKMVPVLLSMSTVMLTAAHSKAQSHSRVGNAVLRTTVTGSGAARHNDVPAEL